MSVLSASSAIHVAASAPTAGSKPRCMASAARGLSARAGSKFFGAGATANAAASLRVAPRGRAADGNAPPRSRGARLVVQANLFNRLGRVIGSYANSLVSSAEDPEKILEQTVIEMGEDLVKMRQASAQVSTPPTLTSGREPQ
jgi:phage shock protein A